MKNIILTIIFILISVIYINAQISEGGKPYSFNGKNITTKVPVVRMPEINADSLIAYDAIENKKGSGPWIFGYNHFTHISPDSDGLWETLPNGDRIWRVIIECPKAMSINLTFDRYILPEGATLFVYNEDRNYVLGAFTSKNNQASFDLGVDIVPGSRTVLEYYEPIEVKFKGELSIYRVTHGYKDLFKWAKAFGDAGSCNYNVNCTPIGTGWSQQRDAVAIIVVGGSGACTGAMVDDVPHSNTPYFLTANHCGTTGVSTWVFRWNWQAAGCPNPTSSPSTAQSVSGSILRATNTASDVTLLELNTTPPASYNVFYAGWDRSGVAPTSGMCIHHPSGDIKKISRSSTAFTSVGGWGAPANSHWQVDWTADSGITEPGSSGSPVFDQNQRVVGQLHGGPSYCGVAASGRHDDYGKFSMSWTGNGATSASARLRDWLDPSNTGALTTDGHYYGVVPSSDSLDLSIDSLSEPKGSYCSDSSFIPVVKVTNQGTNTVYSFIVRYRLNTGTWSAYNWSGTLASLASVNVTLPVLNTVAGTHTFTVCTASPNTRTDQDNANDTLRSTFKIRRGATTTFTIKTDDYPGETSLAIYNPANGDTLLLINRGDLTATRTIYNYALCMSDICYRLKIYDQGNDGICCAYGNGYFLATNGSDTILYNSAFTNNATINFCNYKVPNIAISASDVNLCLGDGLSVATIEQYTTTRSWSITGPGLTLSDTATTVSVTPSNTGTYNVVLYGYNAYGSDTSTLNVVVTDLPTATFSITNATTASNGSISATVVIGALPVSHQWSNGMTGNSINGLAPGLYYDTLTDANGCKSIDSARVQNAMGVEEIASVFVTMYPNPFNQYISIVTNNVEDITKIELHNIVGAIIPVDIVSRNANTIELYTGELPKGIYYITISSNRTKTIFKALH